MSYNTIAVLINDADTAERLIKYGALVARQFNAHLIALHFSRGISSTIGGSPFVDGQILDAIQNAQRDEASSCRKIFEKLTKREDYVSEWRTLELSGRSMSDMLCEQVRSVDLVIMAQSSGSDGAEYKNTLETVIRKSGRPVLVMPYIGNFDTIGQAPLLGWSPTREATRAIHDALPFIKASKESTIMVITPKSPDEAGEFHTAKDLAAALARHGANVTVKRRLKGSIAIGDELLNEAFETGADLIVTGAYGHSAIYDFVIGATTSHLLDHMTAPVLFSK